MLTISFFILLFKYITSLDIHVIPHSHMDPGWIKTYEEYYNQQVKHIFDNVFIQLTNETDFTDESTNNRTFVYCEMINFKRWYISLNETQQQQIKQLIKQERIEFVGGGLVMNDEANSLYQDIIDQLRKGNQFIKEEFNITSNIGWMLDPFGHSEGNALIHSALGFEYLVINRIDYQEHMGRVENGTLEFIWKPFNGDKSIFTNILPYHYGTSSYFNFLHDETKKINDDRIANFTETFVSLVKNKTNGYLHDQYLFLLGDDFTFYKKNYLFQKAEAIMNHIKTNSTYKDNNITMFYSTPSKYFKAVKQKLSEKNIELPIETSLDFFPYADYPYAYWTGYFTSRPYLKGMAKYLSNLHLTSSTFLLDTALQKRNNQKDIQLLRLQNMVGLLQHHDAITGTAKEKVSNDYIIMGKNASNETTHKIINVLKENDYLLDINDINICLSNPTIDYGCNNTFSLHQSDINKTIIGLVNPGIEGEILITMEFKIEESRYKIYNKKNDEIPSDFYCLDKTNFNYNYTCFLTFFYEFSKDIILSTFTIEKTNDTNVNQFLQYPTSSLSLMQNQGNIKSLIFHPNNQSFSILIYETTLREYNFNLYHGFYQGFNKKNSKDTSIRPRKSNFDGAYIFAPTQLRPTKFEINTTNSFYYIGNISTVFMLSFSNDTYMLISVFYSPFIFKVDSIIAPILIFNDNNYILGLNSNIQNNISLNTDITENENETSSEFWTDSNGLQMKRRIINHRNYKYIPNEPVAHNFYPVTTAISLRERNKKEYFSDPYEYLTQNDKQLTIFTDRPQSGSSLLQGEIMLIILRSSLSDDQRGVGEPLYETASSKVFFKLSHFIMIGHSIYTKYKSIQNNYRSLSMIHNSFYRSPLLFKTNSHNKITSFLNQLFIISDNIYRNVDIISDDFAVVQFYRVYDYYFYGKSGNYGGLLSIRKDNQDKVRIEIDSNGIHCIDAKKIMLKKENKKFLQVLQNNINIDIKMKENEFIFVYLYFQ